jgi:flagellar hook-associated protein 1 FlgK
MARIWSMMDVGKRSLANSQTSLQTVAHNIASKSTDGYSRQRVDLVTNEPIGEGNLRIGMGARAGTVSRTVNPYLEKQLEREGNGLGYADARADTMGRVEQVYNEQINKGLNQFAGEFFNAFKELSNNPESLAARTAVKETGSYLAKDFKRIDNQLTEIQKDSDFRIATKVNEINTIVKEISKLNDKITQIEMGGPSANDERDRRDKLVKDLSNKVNIRYAEGDNGQITITAGNTAVLVSGGSYREIYVGSTPANQYKAEGNFDVFYKSTDEGTPQVITRQLTGGEIGGLLQVRDEVINDYKDNLDEVAYKLTTEVNNAHMQGYDRHDQLGDYFFKPIDQAGAARAIDINDRIAEDVSRIAAAAAPGSPGDNRVANVISSLQYKQIFDHGTATVDDYYSSMVGKVGIEAQRAVSSQSSQKDIVGQLKNIRESVSGVSLDEETTKMIEFQKAFDASARLIRTADEMMDTVLNLKRL